MIKIPSNPEASMKAKLLYVAVAGMALSAITAGAQPIAIGPASTVAVFISKSDFEKAIATRQAGTGVAGLGATRAGDDRVNVDVLKRTDPKGEGPVTHDIVTEVYYIIDGGGMFETGGTITDPKPMMTNGKPTNPANIGPSESGTAIVGGVLHHLGVGDVVMIPPNTPHRFKTLDGSVTYMVVRLNPGYEKGK